MATYQMIKLMPESEWNVSSQQRRQRYGVSQGATIPSDELLMSTIKGLMQKDHNNSKTLAQSSLRQDPFAAVQKRPKKGSSKQPELEHYAVDNIDLAHYKPVHSSREDILLDACQLAYYNHQPIVFSPDLVYGYLAKGIALHINKYPEELRKLYVSHDGKKKLIYRNDSFVRGKKENDWADMFKNFADQLKTETKGNSVVQNDLKFSTSTPMTEAHRHVLAMESMKSYFEYMMLCGCGTACVILEGTAEDWKLLQDKVTAQLREINEYCDANREAKSATLKWWSPTVELLLENFVSTYNSQERGVELSEELKLWWGAIYKYNAGGASGMGGPTYITGWVNIFYPYLSQNNQNSWVLHWSPIVTNKEKLYKTLKSIQAPPEYDDHPFFGSQKKLHPDEIIIDPDSYTSYVASVPFKWVYHREEFNMKALIGYSILGEVAVEGGEYPVGTLKVFPAWAIYYDN